MRDLKFSYSVESYVWIPSFAIPAYLNQALIDPDIAVAHRDEFDFANSENQRFPELAVSLTSQYRK